MRQPYSRVAVASFALAFATAPPCCAELLVSAGTLGPSAPALLRPVANRLHFEMRDGVRVIAGETGPTADYQLMSEPITLAPETQGFVMRLEGEVLQGGMYCALLNDSGQFIEPPRNLGVGRVSVEDCIVRSRVNRVAIVLGNIGDGVRSVWLIRRCELVQLDSKQIKDGPSLRTSAPALIRPVQNQLHLEVRDGVRVITGETGPMADYQLMSGPTTLAPETKGFVLRLEGEVLRGGMYCALLNDSGQFIEPPRNFGVGRVSVEEFVGRSRFNRVAIVLGNVGDGVRSLWVVRRFELVQLDSQQVSAELLALARKEQFQGSAFAWALDVLLARRPPRN
jgi:hypothetical protein